MALTERRPAPAVCVSVFEFGLSVSLLLQVDDELLLALLAVGFAIRFAGLAAPISTNM